MTGAFTRKRADGSLHGKGFTLKRAEGSLHGEGCLQDVQRALCTFEGKSPPVQTAPLLLSLPQNWEPIRLNFKVAKGDPKFTEAPRRRIFHFSVRFGQPCRHVPARFPKRADMCLLWR